MAEILAFLMPDSDATKIGALLILALVASKRVGQFQLDRIKGDRGMEYLRVKLQL